ncbi:type II toxin-antitoxin system RelE family toxin [Methanosarcina sp. UBA289]|mgnify:CR=1 FL=1|uniref:type II toxin-antitoxin system RelE family toxin n=1 Tax=Methanosarcina sp. UBA289 TaxID=1915574 RepID=UPI0025EC6C99|nr:type II toxin-antitoxin system RelE/ParE family toxin [Methanosarcina sp. UBA289]
MYKLLIKGKLSKELRKLNKKNHILFEAVFKKVDEICINPQHYKNLNYPLNKYKRVHIDSNFVLCFSVDEKEQTVTLVKLAHHKEAY